MARAFASPNPSRTQKDHQAALARILRTTRQVWMLDVLPAGPALQAPPSRPRVRLPRLAARAFEAQIMAIRCQKVFAA
ncbi:hypothetical protein CupriaWKF_21700 [Cupriavidus sp. WKF15]|uniref:hypothetical protein n=1 Tax=Cupriavidus sp. WKF15 TaxID=3032282 RepID=UPI0023E09EF8|nr:hypothetical protein [Cupriavidus sp. WKF15]WER49743.1 hypothetical protein CupriaWKF_21700 [Cupriavidus sp. WKF15]